MRTLVVNLYGGPGASKSTTAALTFGKLKARGVNAELITEFAKDLTWEERHQAIRCQPYIFGKQMFRVERLQGKVDVVVTDSPILLSAVYGASLGKNFIGLVKDTHESWWTLDILLRRNNQVHPYNPAGRWQTLEQAMQLDNTIEELLTMYGVGHEIIDVVNSEAVAERVVQLAEEQLRTPAWEDADADLV